MKSYFVEGVYIVRQAGRRKPSTPASAEPFAKTIWAINAEEALQLATLELNGGEWMEEPKVSQSSEEQRMRAMGAPELPGFGAATKTRRGAQKLQPNMAKHNPARRSNSQKSSRKPR